MEAASEAADFFICGEHAVAWNKDGNRIGAAGATDGADGAGLADGFGNFTVAFGFAGRNFLHRAPDAFLKFRADDIQWRKFDLLFAGQEFAEGGFGHLVPLTDISGHAVFRFRGFSGRMPPWKIECGEAAPGIVGEEFAFACRNGKSNGLRVHLK